MRRAPPIVALLVVLLAAAVLPAAAAVPARRVSGSGVPKGRVPGTTPGRKAKRANGARITIRVRR